MVAVTKRNADEETGGSVSAGWMQLCMFQIMLQDEQPTKKQSSYVRTVVGSSTAIGREDVSFFNKNKVLIKNVARSRYDMR